MANKKLFWTNSYLVYCIFTWKWSVISFIVPCANLASSLVTLRKFKMQSFTFEYLSIFNEECSVFLYQNAGHLTMLSMGIYQQ